MMDKKDVVKALRSGNRAGILEALESIRSDGDAGLLKAMLDSLPGFGDPEILEAVERLLCDLRDQDCADVLVEYIKDPEYTSKRSMLLAACWQNRLSYSRHATHFLDIVLKNDYAEAIEAFTILEEAAGEMEASERRNLLKRLSAGLSAAPEEKRALLLELASAIKAFDEPANSSG
ncbi:MAG: hypothetical protein CSA96_04415 [Bacteroidetes bacterium]|nr:MAG: hypothetical protein CSA96_04415 [Bacteroidota bacterium]